ncbi:MAG: site-2 protease family protein [Candidatus Nanoarchaeia archaeon]
MPIKKFFTIRVWVLIFALIITALAISYNPWAEGVEIKTVESNSLAAEQGLTIGQKIISVNDIEIKTVQDYKNSIAEYETTEKTVEIETNKGKFSYNVTNSIGFTYENLTIKTAETYTNLEMNMEVIAINGVKVTNSTELKEEINKILPQKKISIVTNKGEYTYLTRGKPEITVGEARKSNLKQGLELSGGTRVLLEPKSDQPITDKDISDLIKVMDNRLNVYGLADLKIRPANDLSGRKFVLVELGGATADEVKELIGKQGKFEAKIGNETVFTGGKKDIPFVCRDDGSCSGVRECNPTGENQWVCTFEFAVHLSPEAAKRHAEITKNMDVVTSTDGREILNTTIDFYLDEKMVDSLQIGADLKGKETTAIAISGPGVGQTQGAAIDQAIKNMDRLQTIIITGSLPYEIQIVKLDSISPVLGKEFLNNSLLIGLLGITAVAIVIFIRYKQIKVIIPIMIVATSEIFITLGVAAILKWNLDLASIAGIIAAVATGVDDQIVITDELIKGDKDRFLNWKERIKRAFFIVFSAYAVTVAAMIPLWNAGAGLIRGFAVTTIIGLSVGVFITRPAFASMMEKLLAKD